MFYLPIYNALIAVYFDYVLVIALFMQHVVTALHPVCLYIGVVGMHHDVSVNSGHQDITPIRFIKVFIQLYEEISMSLPSP